MENVPEVFLNHPDPDDAFCRTNFLYKVIRNLAVDIDDVIGDIPFALVDHVRDVDLVFGQEMRDLFDHARQVLIRDGKPLITRTIKGTLGEID
jgi:hypothetical protein